MSRLPCQSLAVSSATASTAATASATSAASARCAAASARAARRAPVVGGEAAALAETARSRAAPRGRARASCARSRRRRGAPDRRGNRRAQRVDARPGSARSPQMLGQEIEKEGEVAAIGGDRMRRGAALAGEPSGPQPDRGAQIVGAPRTARAAAAPAASGKRLPVWPAVTGAYRSFEPLRDGDARARGRERSATRCRGPDGNGPALRVPMHSSPTGAARPNDSRNSACERTRPGGAAEQGRVAMDIGCAAAPSRSAPSSSLDRARGAAGGCRAAAAAAVRAALSTPSVTTSTSSSTARSVVTICNKVLEARRREDRQRRLVHPALARQIAAAGRDQGPVLVVQPDEIAALPLEQEMLEIERRRRRFRRVGGAQQPQRFGMPVEEIGVLRADRRRRRAPSIGCGRRRDRAAARLRLVAGDRPWLPRAARRERGSYGTRHADQSSSGTTRTARSADAATMVLAPPTPRASVADARRPPPACAEASLRRQPASRRRPAPRVRVLLPLPLAGAARLRGVRKGRRAPPPGSFVRVTLGPRQLVGVVWDGRRRTRRCPPSG